MLKNLLVTTLPVNALTNQGERKRAANCVASPDSVIARWGNILALRITCRNNPCGTVNQELMQPINKRRFGDQ